LRIFSLDGTSFFYEISSFTQCKGVAIFLYFSLICVGLTMKIEVAESLCYSWLKHIINCQLVQTNWKPSTDWTLSHENKLKQIKVATAKYFEKYHALEIYNSDNDNSKIAQLLKQAEIDVLGISFDHAAIQKIYAIEVAFHESGLNYGKKTLSKIIKKLVRTALCLYGYFDIKDATIIFATPKVTPSLRTKLEECITEAQTILSDSRIDCNFQFELITNDEFKNRILDPVIEKNIEDTNELFVRSVKLLKLFKNITDKPSVNQ